MFRSLLFIFLPAVCVTLFTRCENDPAKVNSLTAYNYLPAHTAKDVDLTYTDSARIKIHLTAPQVDDYPGNDAYTEFTKGVRVDFYDDSAKVNAWLTANYAIRKDYNHIMQAKNNVIVMNTKGEKLQTETLTWDGNRHTIFTDDSVKITTATKILYGKGMTADETFTNYEIKHPSGSFPISDTLNH